MLNQLIPQATFSVYFKIKNVMHFGEVIPFLEIYSQEIIRKVFKDISISLFISASLKRLKNGEKAICLLIGNYLNEL